jgi:hypothetical protein
LLAGFLWGNLKENVYSEDTVLDGRIVLKWIFKAWDEGHGLD